ncbi:TIGR02302 family protein [Aquamicrobium segne]|uniref:TIGR02302 family protein n=1 Tax=Aquamicrobium segne TaxID=469547 RepID=A0ABW0GX50_9HYPH
MSDHSDIDITRRLKRQLFFSRLLTRTAMVAERLWPLVLPFVLLVGLFISLSWFGVFALLPEGLRIVLVGVFAVAVFSALWLLRFFHLPTALEIDRRIETVNRLEHSPLQMLDDRPSGARTPFGEALWNEHRQRMAARLGQLAPATPNAQISKYDPWGLRAAIALLLFVAFAFSFGPLGGRLSDPFRPTTAHEAITARIDAWVTPPTYTDTAPLFLTTQVNRDVASFTIPENSTLSLRVTGGSGNEVLSYASSDGQAQAIEPAAVAEDGSLSSGQSVRQFSGILTENGTLALQSGGTLQSGGREIGRWNFSVIPDQPPTIRFTAEPGHAANGTLELTYEIKDDYGAASAKAIFEQEKMPTAMARPLYDAPEMALTLPRRSSKTDEAKTVKNLTEHVWAGTPIRLRLEATDAAGQSVTSKTISMMMPERNFSNPLARAIIEQRRLLGLDANAKARVLDLIDAITLRPEDTFDSPGTYLALISVRSRLKLATSNDQLRDVVAYMWQVALGLEDGNLSEAEQRLQQAQQALQDALRDNASDAEIQQLMQELRQAMDDYLREFAQRNQNRENTTRMPQNGQELRQGDLERMLDQIENLARSGNREQAQELLSQLQDMMNNLQTAQPQQGQQGQSGEFSQDMNRLGDIMRRQQETMNETFRLDQMQRGDNNQNRGQGQMEPDQGQDNSGMSPEELAEALKQLQEEQEKLQQDLQELGKSLEGKGMQPNEGFGQANRAMGQAGKSLNDGEGERAVGHQGQALEALRQGARDMMQQLQAMQGEEGEQGQGEGRQNADRDPLGRPRATQGPNLGDSVKIPDEIDVQRARRILDAIRERLGDALAPQIERQYLERLLEQK